MTQQDLDQGILNVVVGFAPLRPAEFVIIRIGLWTSQHAHADAVAHNCQLRGGRYVLRVIFDGHEIPGVSRVRGIGQLTELITVHDGSDPSSSHAIVGRTKFERITIERGFTEDNAFATWARRMQQGGGPPTPQERPDRVRYFWQQLTFGWNISGAVPVKYAVSDLNACGNDVAIEEITLDHDGLHRDEDPRQ